MRDGQGNAYATLPLAMRSVLLTKAVHCETAEDPVITKGWVCDGSIVYAQEVLRTVATFWSPDDVVVRWNHVYQNFDRILSRARLHEGLQRYLGIFIRHVIHQIPGPWPTFLPDSWCVTCLSMGIAGDIGLIGWE